MRNNITYVVAEGLVFTDADKEVLAAVIGKKYMVSNSKKICDRNERFTGATAVINLTGRKDIDEFYKDILIDSPVKVKVVQEAEVVPTPEVKASPATKGKATKKVDKVK